MARNAFMAAQRRSFVSGDLTEIQPGQDVFDAFWAAGLHGSIIEMPMTGVMADGSLVEFPSHKGIGRQDLDGTVTPYAVPGTGYQIVQDGEVGQTIQALLDEGVFTSLSQVGSLAEGARVFVIGKIGDEYEIAGDPHRRGIMFSWSHDGSGSIKVTPSIERLHCTNQIPALFRSRGIASIKHTASAKDRLARMAHAVRVAVGSMDEYDEAYERLATTSVDEHDTARFVRTVFPIDVALLNTNEDMLSRGEKRSLTMMQNKRSAFYDALASDTNTNIFGTAAALAQAAIEIADHSAAFGSAARRGARVLTGAADEFKKSAFDAALALV